MKQFTDEDKEALTSLQAQMTQLRGDTKPGEEEKLDPAVRKKLMDVMVQARDLSWKQADWQAYNAEQNRLEHQGHLTQQVLELGTVPHYEAEAPLNTPGTILARVKPYIFYSPSTAHGDVDFTIPPLTTVQEKRVQDLKDLISIEIDPVQQVEMEDELADLLEQKEQCRRAHDYLERANKVPELMLAIRRDSMYPYKINEQGPWRGEMFNIPRLVSDWLTIRKDILPPALQKIGIGDGTQNHDAGRQAGDQLSDRLFQDMERSRRLWLGRQAFLAQMKQVKADALKRRKALFAKAMLADAAVNPPVRFSDGTKQILSAAGIDPADAARLTALSEAIMMRHVPESPPRVEVGLVEALGEDGKPEIRTDVKVVANPDIYLPPYQAVSYQITPDDARQVVASRQYKGLPVEDEETLDAIKEFVQAYDDAAKDASKTGDALVVRPPILTFVFCKDVRIPNKVVPATIARLPVLKHYSIPMPDGMKGPPPDPAQGYLTAGYLFGSAALPPERLPQPSEVYIATRRIDAKGANAIEITSKALGKLKGNESIHFIVYRGMSPAGPFQKIEFQDGVLDASTSVQDATNRPGRIAKDKLLLIDGLGSIDDTPGPTHGPLYYQVGQIVSDERSMPGEETRSNITRPEKAMIIVEGLDEQGVLRPFPAPDTRFVMGVRLGLEDQYCDLWGAEVKVSTGKWTGLLLQHA